MEKNHCASSPKCRCMSRIIHGRQTESGVIDQFPAFVVRCTDVLDYGTVDAALCMHRLSFLGCCAVSWPNDGG